MKVIHLLWSGAIGGAARAAYQLASYQTAHEEFEVALGFGQARGEFADRAIRDGVIVHDFRLTSGYDLRSSRRTVGILQQYDVHHFHAPELVLMLPSFVCAGATRIYTHRAGVIPYAFRRRLRYRLLGPMVRHGFFAVTGTRQAARAAGLLWGLPYSEVIETVNGVDPEQLRSTREREAIRLELGIPPAAVVIGAAAHLRELKRLDRLIRAAEPLADENVVLLIVGDGPDRDRLVKLASSLLPQTHYLFPGMVNDVADWLAAMDIFVLPTGPEESFGNAVVEAMACGLPVIVYADSPALAAHVTNGTGFVVQSEPELTSRLTELIGDPSLRQHLGTAARDRALKVYPMERMAKTFRDLYLAAS
jgi:glycosyltransferase involved in cell wall biosynthesis